jgi:hypothetical protein
VHYWNKMIMISSSGITSAAGDITIIVHIK